MKNTVDTTLKYFYHRQNEKCDSVLPLTLISFNGTITNANLSDLRWITASESNTSHFEIEWSMNACVFTKVGQVPAAGNSSNNINYLYLHNGPKKININNTINDRNYYRLKMVDLDGRYSYSNIIVLRCTGCTAPPASACNGSITGLSAFCSNNIQKYTLSNLSPTMTVNWSVNPAASVSMSSGTCAANLQRLTTSGTVTLSAQVLGCPTPITKVIQLSDPPLQVSTTNTTNTCNGVTTTTHTASVTVYPGSNSNNYAWYVNGSYNGTGYSRTFTLTLGQHVSYQVVYNGPCGQQTYNGDAYGGGINPVRYTISPNPANTQVQVQRPLPCDPPIARMTTRQEPLSAEIYDLHGNLKKRAKIAASAKSFTIPTHDLPSGNYLLRITENGQTESQQIRIEH